jgi:putative transcriptional regulator
MTRRRDGEAAQDEAGSPDDARAIGVRLDALLDERGMTLTELSHRVGVTIVNLSVLKNGRARAIRFSTLARLCEVLGCQPGDLLSYRAGQPAGP